MRQRSYLIELNYGRMSVEEMWNKLLEMGISEQTLRIVTNINGYNDESMKDILYAEFGYRDFDQL